MASKTKAEKQVAILEERVAKLEELVQPFVHFDPQLGLATRRGVTVVDIGIKVVRLRELVDCAIEIEGRARPEEEEKKEE